MRVADGFDSGLFPFLEAEPEIPSLLKQFFLNNLVEEIKSIRLQVKYCLRRCFTLDESHKDARLE